jgi:hypothetical protein
VTFSTLARGEVVLTRFPFTDLTGAALRPAVVVKNSTRKSKRSNVWDKNPSPVSSGSHLNIS